MENGSSLAGRVAVITGGGAGIGLASARRLASEGASVLLGDINVEALGGAVEQLQADGFTASCMQVDITDEADVEAMISAAVDRYGRIDVLVNNAGIAGDKGSLATTERSTWDKVITTNLTGTFLSMKHGIAAMLKGSGGVIINNASVLGLVGLPNSPAYTASKGGIIQLTRTAALENATKGIRVNCLCPGLTQTEMFADSAADLRGSFLKLFVPMGRFALAEEIAEAVLFLASDRSSFMTGAVIPVDGGYIAR
jgi:NAD(P)-dependent dehydrogenase (short-subunit alcohol dehydrogenase family)